jgi:hypothetical protein
MRSRAHAEDELEVCFFAPYAAAHLAPCEGGLTDHHVVPRRKIRDVYPRGLLLFEDGTVFAVPKRATRVDSPRPHERFGRNQMIADRRNIVRGCIRHHLLFEGYRIEVPLDAWPRSVFEFAIQFELAGELAIHLHKRAAQEWVREMEEAIRRAAA